jgi:hypothetical protein
VKIVCICAEWVANSRPPQNKTQSFGNTQPFGKDGQQAQPATQGRKLKPFEESI